MTITESIATLDVRRIPPRDRHAQIFSTFQGLAAGQSMEIVNDHDPKPLYFHFQSEFPAKFSWDYVETGPAVWRVRIAKLAATHSNGQCCGSCGGA